MALASPVLPMEKGTRRHLRLTEKIQISKLICNRKIPVHKHGNFYFFTFYLSAGALTK